MKALTTLAFVIAWPSHKLHLARTPAHGHSGVARGGGPRGPWPPKLLLNVFFDIVTSFQCEMYQNVPELR